MEKKQLLNYTEHYWGRPLPDMKSIGIETMQTIQTIQTIQTTNLPTSSMDPFQAKLLLTT